MRCGGFTLKRARILRHFWEWSISERRCWRYLASVQGPPEPERHGARNSRWRGCRPSGAAVCGNRTERHLSVKRWRGHLAPFAWLVELDFGRGVEFPASSGNPSRATDTLGSLLSPATARGHRSRSLASRRGRWRDLA